MFATLYLVGSASGLKDGTCYVVGGIFTAECVDGNAPETAAMAAARIAERTGVKPPAGSGWPGLSTSPTSAVPRDGSSSPAATCGTPGTATTEPL